MKTLFTNITLFVSLIFVTSSFTGCGGTVATGNNGAPANKANITSPNTNVGGSQSSVYPLLSPDIAQVDLDMIDGTKAKVADRKGKVVLLNLWAIWCGPCKAEMPELIALQDKYRDNGFQIIGLDIGDGSGTPEEIPAIKAFSEKMKLNYELARIPGDVTQKFNKVSNFAGVPQSLLVDREGHLRGVFIGGGPTVIDKLKETLEKVMSE